LFAIAEFILCELLNFSCFLLFLFTAIYNIIQESILFFNDIISVLAADTIDSASRTFFPAASRSSASNLTLFDDSLSLLFAVSIPA